MREMKKNAVARPSVPYHGELDLLVSQHYTLRLGIHIFRALLIKFTLLQIVQRSKMGGKKLQIDVNCRNCTAHLRMREVLPTLGLPRMMILYASDL